MYMAASMPTHRVQQRLLYIAIAARDTQRSMMRSQINPACRAGVYYASQAPLSLLCQYQCSGTVMMKHIGK